MLIAPLTRKPSRGRWSPRQWRRGLMNFEMHDSRRHDAIPPAIHVAYDATDDTHAVEQSQDRARRPGNGARLINDAGAKANSEISRKWLVTCRKLRLHRSACSLFPNRKSTGLSGRQRYFEQNVLQIPCTDIHVERVRLWGQGKVRGARLGRCGLVIERTTWCYRARSIRGQRETAHGQCAIAPYGHRGLANTRSNLRICLR